MESLNLNVRVDAKDKRNFEKFCNSVGMNVSTAINMFIKVVLKERKLPFEIRDDYDDYVYERLKEAEVQMKENTKKYSKEELLERMNNIINEYDNK